MPKYRFICPKCQNEKSQYVASSVLELVCDKCSNNMSRQLPNIGGQTEVKEIVDPYTNKRWGKDQQAILADRKEEHYWDVEVPRMVQTYSLETCLEEKWLIYNDKGELVINKPPSKR